MVFDCGIKVINDNSSPTMTTGFNDKYNRG
ncbi:uncharacterized protein METZ01_LOCUS345661 [marine metagenome]|uniref:Uncharacterized protein n=1 Tax=marine metagenome TaxID=408172 RepID=A0A382R6L8_9ZZZZ